MKPQFQATSSQTPFPQRPELGLRVFAVVCEMHRNAVPSLLHGDVFSSVSCSRHAVLLIYLYPFLMETMIRGNISLI